MRNTKARAIFAAAFMLKKTPSKLSQFHRKGIELDVGRGPSHPGHDANFYLQQEVKGPLKHKGTLSCLDNSLPVRNRYANSLSKANLKRKHYPVQII